jgi:maleamate amidohydrolase
VFTAGGFDAVGGFGKRPSLVVIDVNWLFRGDKPEPILDSIKRWRSSRGEESWVAVEYIRQLVEAARGKGLPVIYTTNYSRLGDNWDAGSWRWKNKRRDEDKTRSLTNLDPSEIVTPIAPGPRDTVIHKQKSSGFFGTNMAAYLTLLDCDSQGGLRWR